MAIHLLTLQPPPVIIIHTGVIEPRLSKDLMARGVDDILFKPCDFGHLAAKVKSLVERRLAAVSPENGASTLTAVNTDYLHEPLQTSGPVSGSQLDTKLSGLSRIVPVSKAAFDVYNLTSIDESDSLQVAAAIQRDATLAAEVLRLANSSFYNSTGQPIIHLERAVMLIGQKRIGELALATNALTALTSGMLPWMDISLTWKRSMAAGLAVEMLIDEGQHQNIEKGLLLSAIMHPLGRVVLGMLYPKHYETMIEQCLRNDEPVLERERKVFPISHAEVMAHLLAIWNIPAEIHHPLKNVLTDYTLLGGISEPTRLKTELLRLAVFIGEIAVGKWEPWDLIDLPPATLFKRLGIASVTDIIEQIKGDVERLATLRTDRPVADDKPFLLTPTRELAYCNLSSDPFDFVATVVSTMGIKLVEYSVDELEDFKEIILVNCVRTAPQRLATNARHAVQQQLLIVTDGERVTKYSEYGRTLAMPTSYSRLRSACWKASRNVGSMKEAVGSAVSS